MTPIRHEMPQYRVILCNDEVNSMEGVSKALATMLNMSVKDACETAMRVHTEGEVVIAVTHLELAEHLHLRMGQNGLTMKLEAVEEERPEEEE